jgi:hypothetical protein
MSSPINVLKEEMSRNDKRPPVEAGGLLVSCSISVNHESFKEYPKTGLRAYAHTSVFGLTLLIL